MTAEIIDSPKETSSLATPPTSPKSSEQLHSNEANGVGLAEEEEEKEDEDEIVEGEEASTEQEIS